MNEMLLQLVALFKSGEIRKDYDEISVQYRSLLVEVNKILPDFSKDLTKLFSTILTLLCQVRKDPEIRDKLKEFKTISAEARFESLQIYMQNEKFTREEAFQLLCLDVANLKTVGSALNQKSNKK
jgi:hypothetical protein